MRVTARSLDTGHPLCSEVPRCSPPLLDLSASFNFQATSASFDRQLLLLSKECFCFFQSTAFSFSFYLCWNLIEGWGWRMEVWKKLQLNSEEKQNVKGRLKSEAIGKRSSSEFKLPMQAIQISYTCCKGSRIMY